MSERPAGPRDGLLAGLAEPHRGRLRSVLEAAGPPAVPLPAPAADAPALQVLLGVLAEPHRQELVRVLEHEQLTQRQLMARTGLSQPLLSHHLKALREAGLVERTVCQRLHVYRLRAATLTALAARLTVMADNARATASVPPC